MIVLGWKTANEVRSEGMREQMVIGKGFGECSWVLIWDLGTAAGCDSSVLMQMSGIWGFWGLRVMRDVTGNGCRSLSLQQERQRESGI